MNFRIKYELILVIITILLYEYLCYKFILIRKPMHGDEHHFYRTIVEFSENFGARKLLDYNELITPFTFILYGFYGKLFGTDLFTLRTFSLIIAGMTHFIFFIFLKKIFNNTFLIWTIFFIWIFNPYIIGFNALIFTDGLSNLLIILFLLALYKKNYWLIFICSALLIFTRQYNILIILSAGLITLLEHIKQKKADLKLYSSLILGLLVVTPLFIYWQGFSPRGNMNLKLQEVPFKLYMESIPVYIYCIFIFSFPISPMLLFYKKLKSKVWFFTIGIALLFYILFPVAPSYIAVKDGFSTVGLFDKAITSILGTGIYKHIILFIFFLFGCLTLYILIKEFFQEKNNNNKYSYNKFLLVYIIIFLISMVFNFQIWEKYFIQIFPASLILMGTSLEKSLQHLSNNFQRLRFLKS